MHSKDELILEMPGQCSPAANEFSASYRHSGIKWSKHMDNNSAVLCARLQSDTPQARIQRPARESPWGIVRVTEGRIRVILCSHTIIRRHLRNKQWLESNEVIEITKLDAQKELLIQRHHLDYPSLQVIDFFVSETHPIFVNGCPMHNVGF